MTSGIMSDYEIAQLIRILRDMTKVHHDWLEKYGDEDMHLSPPNPRNFTHYLRIRNIVRDAMEYRREHRKAVNHVWKVYADSVIKSLEQNN